MDSKQKCSLVMSCGSVINPEDNLPFETGIYGGGTLVVISGNGNESLIRVPQILDLLWDKEVENAFVYLAGFGSSTDSFKKECKSETTKALLKIALDRAGKEKVHLVGCPCDLKNKKSFADEMGLGLIHSDCGGSLALGKIAAEILSKVNV